MADRLIHHLVKGPSIHIGQKAAMLRFLSQKGVNIPSTFICVWDAFDRYQGGDSTLNDQLRTELTQQLDITRPYAVRSSANLEDGQDHSFAGQFQTVINVTDVDNLITALQTVWDSVNGSNVHAYLQTANIDPEALKMAVIIQEMVNPVMSGIVFSKNPLTGLDEIIIEATHGSGEGLVQGSVKPLRWIYKWGEWISQPEDPGVPAEIMLQVVQETEAIAKVYGKPVDLEWVYDGEQIYWVQLRQITSLGNVPFYSNRIAKEVLPGLIKPLVWSINVPLVNGAWVELLTELIGPNTIDPMSLAKSFYGRAYFNMGTMGDIFELMGFPRETLELMMGLENPGPDRPRFKPTGRTYRLMPRMIGFAIGKWRFARRVEKAIPELQHKYDAFHDDRIETLDDRALLAAIDDLFALTQDVAYFNIVIPLMMQLYHHTLNRHLKRMAVDPATFDLTEDLDALKHLDPNEHLHRLYDLYENLPENVQAAITDEDYADFQSRADIAAIQSGVASFLKQFGHLSDSGNDFSVVPWREQPEIVLKMIARMGSMADHRNGKVGVRDLDVPLTRRWLFRLFYRRARQYRVFREQVSSLYTFGYGLFRDYFLELSDRLVARGQLPTRENIFFLTLDEIRALVTGQSGQQEMASRAAERKNELERARDITPPETIFGDIAAPLEIEFSEQLVGVPTSRGHYRGKVRVIRGIQDFEKLQTGDVLVIPYSDVGWTPLFAKAGAVISESGGMLSHSSIVAREYNIPAVVSVPLACQIADETEVSVDGFKGEIFIHQEES